MVLRAYPELHAVQPDELHEVQSASKPVQAVHEEPLKVYPELHELHVPFEALHVAH